MRRKIKFYNQEKFIDKSIIEHLGLSKTFAISSFIAIFFITMLSGYVFFRYLSENMLKQEIEISSNFIHSISRLDTTETEKLESLIASITALPDIISARIYNQNREILWSTQPALIGKVIVGNKDLEKAIRGHRVFHFEELGQHTKREHAYLPKNTAQFVESYLPIWDRTQQHVTGVIEIYKFPQALFDSLTEARKLVLFVSLAGGILLFLFLFWIVNSASNIITRQQANLQLARKHAVARNEHFLSRIGTELHDGPVQSIGFALLRMEDASEDENRRIQRALRDALHEIRNISAGLALPELSNLGGKESILLAADRHKRRTLIPVEVYIDNLPSDLAMPIKMCIYRVVQEGLNNAFRHAPEADVSVTAKIRNSNIIITVKDDGPGFPEINNKNETQDTKLGLAGLKEHVESVGGYLYVNSTVKHGVEISAHIPFVQ